ncbi:MAG TPA: DNA-directed RNA polymerase subunit delta [Erysipelotrichaceae bacterium]|nr:DNA-directed RNA polymerase subunit delta [Erysipelotrichaceae bacterium]
MKKSPMVEAAFSVLEKAQSALPFKELFDQVVTELDLDKVAATKRIAKLYSDITLDSRFLSLEDNMWDLKKRHKLDDTIVDTSDIIIDDEDVDEYDYDYEEEEINDDEDEDDDEEDDEKDLIIQDYFTQTEVKEDYDEDIEEFKELAIASKD